MFVGWEEWEVRSEWEVSIAKWALKCWEWGGVWIRKQWRTKSSKLKTRNVKQWALRIEQWWISIILAIGRVRNWFGGQEFHKTRLFTKNRHRWCSSLSYSSLGFYNLSVLTSFPPSWRGRSKDHSRTCHKKLLSFMSVIQPPRSNKRRVRREEWEVRIV